MNLTDMVSWEEEYYGVIYEAMYNFIVEYLEFPEDNEAELHVKQLMAWWNKYVFSDSQAFANITVTHRKVFPHGAMGSQAQSTTTSSQDLISAQRSARREQAAAAAAATAAASGSGESDSEVEAARLAAEQQARQEQELQTQAAEAVLLAQLAALRSRN